MFSYLLQHTPRFLNFTFQFGIWPNQQGSHVNMGKNKNKNKNKSGSAQQKPKDEPKIVELPDSDEEIKVMKKDDKVKGKVQIGSRTLDY